MESTSMLALLEHSFKVECESSSNSSKRSRLQFLGDDIFDFTTYDDAMTELFAKKAVEVCAAINEKTTFEYIKDHDNYQWYLLMVNMPFFEYRLDWGSSIRGAWWSYGNKKPLNTCGLWSGDKQVTSLTFNGDDQWLEFTRALVDFARVENAS